MVKRYELNFCDNLEESKNGYLVYFEDYQKLEKELAELKEQMRWRDVEQELPNEHETVLVYCKYDRHPVAAYIAHGDWVEEHEYLMIHGDASTSHNICDIDSRSYDAVTHWMPLPNSPTIGEQQ